MLNDAQIDRYARHILLPEIGGQGQEKLLNSKILIVGAGGLGSPAALYLTAAGVGHLGLVDFDVVDRTNLQRQVLYTEDDVGQKKVDIAEKKLRQMNPDVTITPHAERLDESNAESIINNYDVILDGSDNFGTRYLVNDVCVKLGKPNAFGSVLAFEGQASLFEPNGPCYRCVFPHPPPEGTGPVCAEAGVLGVAAGLIGMIQAAEAIKWILQIGDSLSGRLMLVDALHMQFDEVKVARTTGCAVCGKPNSILT
jgi:adenylyltransferase/sulfurtransferase